MLTPLQKYMLQKGVGASGGAGVPAAPMGPGVADPYTQGVQAPPISDPDDGLDEFGNVKQKQGRGYLNSDVPVAVNGRY